MSGTLFYLTYFFFTAVFIGNGKYCHGHFGFNILITNVYIVFYFILHNCFFDFGFAISKNK